MSYKTFLIFFFGIALQKPAAAQIRQHIEKQLKDSCRAEKEAKADRYLQKRNIVISVSAQTHRQFPAGNKKKKKNNRA